MTLADLEADPDPIMRRLRDEAPVAYVDAVDMWLVTRWDDVVWMDDHPELFTAATEPSFLARALGGNMLTADPPEATRTREAMLPSFQPGGVSGRFVAERLASLADELIDAFVGHGEADLMRAFAEPLAAGSLAEVLGLGSHGAAQMWQWCVGVCTDIANFTNDPSKTAIGDRARAELGEAIDARLAELRTAPDGSALADFVAAAPGGQPLTRDEIVNNVRLMISGGINEPRDGVGLVAYVLLRDPALRAAVGDDASSWRRLVEEVLRVWSPVGTITRQATTDIALHGVTIPAGALVAGVLRSANLDERRWGDPTRVDLGRREGGHAAFATGPHRCLGEWLGRQEVRVGAQRLFARLPGLRLADPDGVEIRGFEFRGPTSLVCTWDPAG